MVDELNIIHHFAQNVCFTWVKQTPHCISYFRRAFDEGSTSLGNHEKSWFLFAFGKQRIQENCHLDDQLAQFKTQTIALVAKYQVIDTFPLVGIVLARPSSIFFRLTNNCHLYVVRKCGKVKWGTTLQSIMNAKLIRHRFWHCYENRLIKTIQTIPHNL